MDVGGFTLEVLAPVFPVPRVTLREGRTMSVMEEEEEEEEEVVVVVGGGRREREEGSDRVEAPNRVFLL